MANNDFVVKIVICHYVIFKILILINKQKQGSMGGALLFVLSCIEQEDAWAQWKSTGDVFFVSWYFVSLHYEHT